MLKKLVKIKLFAVALCVVLICALFPACLVDLSEAPDMSQKNTETAIEEWLKNNLKDKLRDYLSDEELKEIVGELFREDIENLVSDAVLSMRQELQAMINEIDWTDFFTAQDLAGMLEQIDFSKIIKVEMIEEILSKVDMSQFIDEEMLKGLLTDEIEDIVTEALIKQIEEEGLLDEILESETFKESVKKIVRDTLRDILLGL